MCVLSPWLPPPDDRGVGLVSPGSQPANGGSEGDLACSRSSVRHGCLSVGLEHGFLYRRTQPAQPLGHQPSVTAFRLRKSFQKTNTMQVVGALL